MDQTVIFNLFVKGFPCGYLYNFTEKVRIFQDSLNQRRVWLKEAFLTAVGLWPLTMARGWSSVPRLESEPLWRLHQRQFSNGEVENNVRHSSYSYSLHPDLRDTPFSLFQDAYFCDAIRTADKPHLFYLLENNPWEIDITSMQTCSRFSVVILKGSQIFIARLISAELTNENRMQGNHNLYDISFLSTSLPFSSFSEWETAEWKSNVKENT